ncbi:MAG: hypothetical protein KBC48_00835 [Candidatus Pacebacteria bacterium]|nr:hypothetical protein [Candidatus Paceibacterota bacterium]
MTIWPIILLTIGGLILTAGDFMMKKWVITNEWWVYATGLAIWLIGLNFLALSFKYKNIAVASVIFVLINVISLAIISWLYFGEPLSWWQIGGLTLGVLAIVILEIS